MDTGAWLLLQQERDELKRQVDLLRGTLESEHGESIRHESRMRRRYNEYRATIWPVLAQLRAENRELRRQMEELRAARDRWRAVADGQEAEYGEMYQTWRECQAENGRLVRERNDVRAENERLRAWILQNVSWREVRLYADSLPWPEWEADYGAATGAEREAMAGRERG